MLYCGPFEPPLIAKQFFRSEYIDGRDANLSVECGANFHDFLFNFCIIKKTMMYTFNKLLFEQNCNVHDGDD